MEPTLRLYRPEAGGRPRLLAEARLAGRAGDLRFDPGSTRLAVSEEAAVTLWDVPTGQPLARLVPPGPRRYGPLGRLAFSADGVLIAADHPGVGLIVWATADGREVAAIARDGNPANSLAFAPDGRSLLVVEPGMSGLHRQREPGVERWDLATGQRGAFYPLPIPYEGELGPDSAVVSWRADGNRGTQAATRDLPNGPTRLLAPYRTTPQDDVALINRPVLALAGRYLLWGTSRGEVLIWDRTTGALVHRLGLGADAGAPGDVNVLITGYRAGEAQVLAILEDGSLAIWPIALVR